MGIWENLGMGGYRGFSRPAARLLQQAVQLAGDLGCEQADTSHLLLAMLQQQGAAAQFLTRKNITEPEVRRQLAQRRSAPAQRLERQAIQAYMPALQGAGHKASAQQIQECGGILSVLLQEKKEESFKDKNA